MEGADANTESSEVNKGEKESTYKIPFNMEELESLIDSALNEMDFGGMVKSTFADLNTTLKTQDRKAKEIKKIFEECNHQVQKLKEDLDANIENLGDQENKSSDRESDDDVQVVDVTYEPKASKLTPQELLMQALYKRKGTLEPGQYYLQPDGILKALPPGQTAPRGTQVVSVRSNNPQQQNQLSQSKHPRPIAPAPTAMKIESLAVGMKLYGKKNNEIWYKGSLVDIQNKDGPQHEKRYKIKYDGKGLKVLNGKNIAFVDPPTSILPVGTRIIALYVDDEMEQRASFYAGIVAESPSVRNSNRYLVFFDDGYAQYSSYKDVRKVYEQSKNVWDDIDPSSTSFIKNYLMQYPEVCSKLIKDVARFLPYPRIWEDINPDCSKFIEKYLTEYPERPMVRLLKGQVIKTEWNGRWWIARVQEVDASLVKMYFDADKRVEWIYRGSTRLEPLYTELANAEANKLRGRRHHLTQKSAKRPFVEYTRQVLDEEQMGGRIQQRTIQPIAVDHPAIKADPSDASLENNGKKRAVAKKSTSKVESQQSSSRGLVASSVSSNRTGLDMASILQNKLGQKDTDELDEDALGEHVEIERNVSDRVRKCFQPHVCSRACLNDLDDDPIKMKGNNPLLIPMLYGWERQIAKQRPSNKKVIFYRTPCARRLRNLKEVDEYLVVADSQLTIDLFCFDPNLHTDSEFVPIKTFCDIKDLSYGKENVPISCVNGIDRQYPDYVDYSIVRTPGRGVSFNLDDEFLCGCDCTDNCMDPKKCQCAQLTIEASKATPLGVEDNEAGYEYRRLYSYNVTGIYECNKMCKCDRRCRNRVAQNGLQLRLQVFKTEKRGWGLRCLDDIPAGGFICVYAGQVLSEQGANEDGQKYGDEYLAELDFIEVVERGKEGYESDVEDIEEGDNEDIEEEEEEEDDGDSQDLVPSESDSTYSGEKRFLNRNKAQGRFSRSVKVKDLSPQNKVQEWVQTLPTAPAASGDAILIISSDEESGQSPQGNLYEPGAESMDLSLHQVDGIHDEEDSSKKTTEDEGSKTELTSTSINTTGQSSAGGVKKDDAVTISSDGAITVSSGRGKTVVVESGTHEGNVSNNETAITASGHSGATTPESEKELNLLVDEDEALSNKNPEEKVEEGFGSLQITEPTSLNVDNAKEEDDDDEEMESNTYQRTTRSQTQSKLGSIPQAKPEEDEDEDKAQYPSLRDLYDDQDCYVMDAKSMGNLGRYLNHSCQPNVFVQNVFIDSHDLRFPWVAFFAAQYIRAGTELTWDYSYEIGSVPGKVLYCYCGAADCRGRLL